MLTQEAYLVHYYRPTLHINLTGTSCSPLVHFHPAHHTPTLPPSAPAPLGIYTQKYLNVFECTQPYFVLLQETLNFFLCSLGGLGPQAPLWLRPCTKEVMFSSALVCWQTYIAQSTWQIFTRFDGKVVHGILVAIRIILY